MYTCICFTYCICDGSPCIEDGSPKLCRSIADASRMNRQSCPEHREPSQMIQDVCFGEASPMHRRTIPDVVSNGTGQFLHRETSR